MENKTKLQVAEAIVNFTNPTIACRVPGLFLAAQEACVICSHIFSYTPELCICWNQGYSILFELP